MGGGKTRIVPPIPLQQQHQCGAGEDRREHTGTDQALQTPQGIWDEVNGPYLIVDRRAASFSTLISESHSFLNPSCSGNREQFTSAQCILCVYCRAAHKDPGSQGTRSSIRSHRGLDRLIYILDSGGRRLQMFTLLSGCQGCAAWSGRWQLHPRPRQSPSSLHAAQRASCSHRDTANCTVLGLNQSSSIVGGSSGENNALGTSCNASWNPKYISFHTAGGGDGQTALTGLHRIFPLVRLTSLCLGLQ